MVVVGVQCGGRQYTTKIAHLVVLDYQSEVDPQFGESGGLMFFMAK